MIEITVKGNSYQRGFELGRLLRKAGYNPPPVPKQREDLVMACKELVEKYTPSLWEELQGVVKGGQYEDEKVWQFELTLLPYPRLGCTIFAMTPDRTSSGKTLFARNYDWELATQDYLALVNTYPDDSLSSIGCTDLTVGRYGGINEAGLAIGLTAVGGYPDDKPGIALHLATRWILDNCSKTEQAIKFMKRIPHFRGNNYIIADESGQIALVEGSPEKVVVSPPSNGLVYAANRFLSSEMRELEDEKLANQTSEARLQIVKDWYNAKKKGITEGDAQAALSGDFSSQNGVCVRYSREGGDWGTIWSWTALLGDGVMNIASGPPNVVAYKSYSL